ncbi:MAG: MBL fold metallo-hydrolase, partial [Oscillospiraceae bacterium]|nr:MBL fold metallo-hydrolase [Oscillospiraceae bacterium]
LPHVIEGYPQRGKAAGMLRQDGGEPVTDDFLHEQTLVFEDDGGLVICSSCSHAGSDNVVKEVMSAFPGKPVKAFIGGFHLMGHGGPETMAFPREEIERLGRFLSENITEAIYTGHCTGTPAYSVLSEVIGDKLHRLSSGLVIEL